MNQNGFNQNNFAEFSGFTNSPTTITQQPGSTKKVIKTSSFYNYQWDEKPSQNGKFKYGLFQCCRCDSVDSEESVVRKISNIHATIAIITCFIPFPGWCHISDLNGEVADVVGI